MVAPHFDELLPRHHDSLNNDSTEAAVDPPGKPMVARYKPDYLLDLPKTIGYMQGGLITGLHLRIIPGGWQAILKRTRKGLYEVAFLEADTWASLLQGCAEWTEKGLWQWFQDKYPPK